MSQPEVRITKTTCNNNFKSSLRAFDDKVC